MCNCTICMCGEVGFRFIPSDEELIRHYLRRKINGHDHRAIPEIDLCKFEPRDLPNLSPVKSGDNFWYFISPVDYKYANSERANRTTKAGYWKVTGQDRPVKDSDCEERIGTKKILGFYEGRWPKGVRSPWTIHEYQLYPADTPDARAYVICRLEKKPVVKNSTLQKVEPGGSSASTSHSKAVEAVAEIEAEAEADNTPTEGTPYLHATREPFHVCNTMQHAVAPQASMQEQGTSLEDYLELNELSKDQNGMQEKGPFKNDKWHDDFSFKETEGGYQFDTIDLEEFRISGQDSYFSDETLNTLPDFRPSVSLPEAGIHDTRETETVMVKGTRYLHAIREPFLGCNSMQHAVAPQASMQEQGTSLEDHLELDDLSKDQNGMQEKGPFENDKWHDGFSFKETEEGYQFDPIDQEEFRIGGQDTYFSDETSNTLHDFRPSVSLPEAGIYDTRKTGTVMVNIENQHIVSEGSSNNQMDRILNLDTSFDDSTAATSYELNSRELILADFPINTRYCESRYQPRSPNSLAEEVPLLLQCGISVKEVPFGDKERGVEFPKSSFSNKRKRERGENSDEN